MDQSLEDMKFIGFFGIFKQSFTTIFSWKKIFAQITLTLILPLTIIFLAHIEISRYLFWKLERNSLLLDTDSYYRLHVSAIEWLYYVLFKIAYFIFLTVFSLLSTAAVVFTVASIYTDREIVFQNVMKIIPKVWKRLLVTFVFIYLVFFIYDIIGEVALAITRSIFNYSTLSLLLTLIIRILYVIGFLYIVFVCELGSVVTVLESSHGYRALRKGKDLANGKKKVGMGIAFVLYGFLEGLLVVYQWFVEYGGVNFNLAMVWRAMIGILCGFLLLMFLLLIVVIQTVLYLVCKSHHGEAIDKLSLSTFLGAYMGETVVYPTAGEEVQLGRPPHQQV
ncbi:uncharacterized protein LOC111900135 [Lactuca sativa]|uniref:Uncharacterized protein n=1 Tax=Lactuca sativa TaxID=4236 RepID=A0A9R1WW44_LACSA|nr:uncharacterized protein LOC111900135 [Lactuca sativa]KAJ0191200.1 hypothetical protein LSAT_V11C800436960 [Lactuca sativa]